MGSKNTRLTVIGCMLSNFVMALMMLTSSAVMSFLKETYLLNDLQIGSLVMIQSVAAFLTNMICGLLSRHVKRKYLMMASSAFITIGIGGIAVVPGIFLLYACFFFTGMAWGMINVLVNIIISETTNGSGKIIALTHTAYSVGAFIAPLLLTGTTALSLSWRLPGILAALLSVGLIFVWMRVPVPESRKKEQKDQNIKIFPLSFLKNPKFYLLTAIFFTYVGIETGLNTWLIFYLNDYAKFSLEMASTSLSVMWVMIIAGRLTVAAIAPKINKTTLLFICCIGFAVSALLLLTINIPAIKIAAVALMGLTMGGVFPVGVSNANDIIISSNLASGIMLAFGGLGASAIPLLAGKVSDSLDRLAGMWVLAVCILVLLAFAIINLVVYGRKIKTENLQAARQ